MVDERRCEWCGQPATSKRKKGREHTFCTADCYTKARRAGVVATVPRNRVSLVCGWCGESYETVPSQVGKSKYCSRSCAGKATPIPNTKGRGHPAWNKGTTSRPLKVCAECGGKFHAKPGQKFCLPACRMTNYAKRKVELACEWCHELFTVDGSTFTHDRTRYCSRKCRGRVLSVQKTDKVMIACERCGTVVPRTRSRIASTKRHFCSNACRGTAVPDWARPGTHKQGFRPDIGHSVRSSWEANICRFFRFMHIDYQYEPKTFDLGETSYRPDFFVGYWVEVKGFMRPGSSEKIERFRSLFPGEVLVILDHALYRQIEHEFSERIVGWEFAQRRRQSATVIIAA